MDEQRARLRDVHIRAAVAEAESAIAMGEAADGLSLAEELLALEPYREDGHRLSMRAHAAAGNRGEALLVWERCRKLLSEELGADPSGETEAVYLDPPHVLPARTRTKYG